MQIRQFLTTFKKFFHFSLFQKKMKYVGEAMIRVKNVFYMQIRRFFTTFKKLFTF